MENKNQNTLALLWHGKNGNVLESLHFALFLFLFSFLLATAPVSALTPGVDVVVSAGQTVGLGYEQTMRRLDRNVTYLPEIVYGAQIALGDHIETMQETNRYVARSLWNDVTGNQAPLVHWE